MTASFLHCFLSISKQPLRLRQLRDLRAVQRQNLYRTQFIIRNNFVVVVVVVVSLCCRNRRSSPATPSRVRSPSFRAFFAGQRASVSACRQPVGERVSSAVATPSWRCGLTCGCVLRGLVAWRVRMGSRWSERGECGSGESRVGNCGSLRE